MDTPPSTTPPIKTNGSPVDEVSLHSQQSSENTPSTTPNFGLTTTPNYGTPPATTSIAQSSQASATYGGIHSAAMSMMLNPMTPSAFGAMVAQPPPAHSNSYSPSVTTAASTPSSLHQQSMLHHPDNRSISNTATGISTANQPPNAHNITNPSATTAHEQHMAAVQSMQAHLAAAAAAAHQQATNTQLQHAQQQQLQQQQQQQQQHAQQQQQHQQHMQQRSMGYYKLLFIY